MCTLGKVKCLIILIFKIYSRIPTFYVISTKLISQNINKKKWKFMFFKGYQY